MVKASTALALYFGFGLASAAQAQLTISEATGNWAGPNGGGFDFRATLTHTEDEADLKIWNGFGGVPDGSGDPDLSAIGFAAIAFATNQELEIVSTSDGSILQVVTEYADEEGEGREVVQIQFIDNQFTMVGYYSRDMVYNLDGGDSQTMECDIDFVTGKIIDLGQERSLQLLSEDDLNASNWRIGLAFDRGWCQR